jgi:hypothetical protein
LPYLTQQPQAGDAQQFQIAYTSQQNSGLAAEYAPGYGNVQQQPHYTEIVNPTNQEQGKKYGEIVPTDPVSQAPSAPAMSQEFPANSTPPADSLLSRPSNRVF